MAPRDYHDLNDAVWHRHLTPGVTFASRHPSYGTSIDPRGKGIVHVVEEVAIGWVRDGPPIFGARWSCGGKTLRAKLMSGLGDSTVCRPCDLTDQARALSGTSGQYTDRSLVYYAKKDGLIKIGWSTQVGLRLVRQKIEVILAVERGGRELELWRHGEFAFCQVVGEWFEPDERLLAHIARLQSGGTR